MIQNLVFDMGNVLVEYQPERYLSAYPEPQRTLLRNEVFRSVEWLGVDRGVLTEEEATAKICRHLPAGLHEAAAELVKGWHEDIPPIPGMYELARDAHTAGYKLYLLSNTGCEFANFRRHIAALEFFSGEFISANWHMLKPDEAIFRAFCAHFSLVPKECFFIDDSPPNVETALRLGFHGAVFHGDAAALRAGLAGAGVRL